MRMLVCTNFPQRRAPNRTDQVKGGARDRALRLVKILFVTYTYALFPTVSDFVFLDFLPQRSVEEEWCENDDFALVVVGGPWHNGEDLRAWFRRRCEGFD